MARHTILRTTLVELGKTLCLEEYALWMPSQSGLYLQLSHTLSHKIQVGSSVPINLPIINELFNSAQAMHIPHTCPLAKIGPPVGRFMPPEVVSVRVPLLQLSMFRFFFLEFSSFFLLDSILASDLRARYNFEEQGRKNNNKCGR
ncbi:unnamed protein product [Arabis nemorensis]|uniref:GAF domain-containing protein n=1 Tax=Arabis nemorensis TaxID=586526 RepID=A0A565C7Z7_9BRAS|nr:unnamed protein product [Arabis nemorensis]